MKIQIQQQSLRVRVDEQELACLLAGGTVENHTTLPGQGSWSQTLQLNAQAAPGMSGTPSALQLTLPHAAVLALAQRLPSRDGLGWELAAAGASLQLQFDVDVRDSVRQRGVPRRADATITPSA